MFTVKRCLHDGDVRDLENEITYAMYIASATIKRILRMMSLVSVLGCGILSALIEGQLHLARG
jgi:hypothetical protein